MSRPWGQMTRCIRQEKRLLSISLTSFFGLFLIISSCKMMLKIQYLSDLNPKAWHWNNQVQVSSAFLKVQTDKGQNQEISATGKQSDTGQAGVSNARESAKGPNKRVRQNKESKTLESYAMHPKWKWTGINTEGLMGGILGEGNEVISRAGRSRSDGMKTEQMNNKTKSWLGSWHYQINYMGL